MISADDFRALIVKLREPAFELNGIVVDDHISWSENVGPPKDAEDFASEAIFVICNSGLHHKVAREIFERVMPALRAGGAAHGAFGHYEKAKAITRIWRDREKLLAGYLAAEDKVEFCGSLPWIGPITKFHLAKNFGADVAKPDIHLERLAQVHNTTPQALCDHIARDVGLKSRTVDLVLWLACAKGVIDSKTGAYLK